MKNKKQYSINERREGKRNRDSIVFSSIATGAVLLAALSCASSIKNCNDSKKINGNKYTIDYGYVKVNGEFFENYDRNSIKVIKTINDEYILAIVDSKNNYYILDDNEWYIIYLKDGANISLICEDGHLVAGVVSRIDGYLNDEEVLKNSFTFEDILNIEKRLNNIEEDKVLEKTM